MAVLALGVIAYLAERSEANRRTIELFSGVVGIVLGALLFAGALADGGSASWPGLIGGRRLRGPRLAGSGRPGGARRARASRRAQRRC